MIKTLIPIDVEIIVKSYKELEDGIQWAVFNKGKQAGLQYKFGEDPWLSATGKSKGDELTFDLLNPYFAGTVFERLIRHFKLKRTRFMWVNPGCCYSMHTDATQRIHIPIYTNTQSFMVFKDGLVEHLPSGHIYLTDTRKLHTAMNCSMDEPRLHLVGATES